MRDELKDVFEAAVNGIIPPSPDVSGVTMRGRKRLRWYLAGTTVTGAAVACAVVVAILSIPGPASLPPATDSRDGYVFTFEILGYDPVENHVELRYSSQWAGDEYPGSRDCPWTFYREDGSVISESVHSVGVQLQPEVTHTTEVTVAEQPASVTGTCGPRLDRGHFRVDESSERIAKLQEFIDRGLPGWAVIFDIEWHGSRRFGTAECMWDIYAADDGRVLRGGSMSYSGPGSTVKQALVRPFNSRPGDVEVDCETL